MTDSLVDTSPASRADATAGRLSSALRRAFAPVDISFLVVFRIVFGAAMLWHAWRYIDRGWIKSLYTDPVFQFKYYGFGWVQPWPDGIMYMHFYALAVLSAFVLVGFYYRLGSALLCLAFWYAFLLEQTRYQNHYYLLGLLSLLMVFLPAHRACSIDAGVQPGLRSATVPAWMLWILRFQIGIPYFFGGVAKLNGDWLHGEPMRAILAANANLPLFGGMISADAVVGFLTYGGLLLDLFIVPLLLWRPTRAWAFAAAVVFHLLNAALFRIGIFPWFMIAATTVYFSPDWPRRLLASRRRPPQRERAAPGRLSFRQKAIVVVLGVYVAVQIFLPLRHFLYPGNVDWTEEGARFAWRMMLRSKTVGVRFEVTRPATGETLPVDLRSYLSPRQVGRMGVDPDAVLQFSHFLSRRLAASADDAIEVRAVVLASLNGRKPQLLIDPDVNLAAQKRTLWHKPWIVLLREPLRDEPWTVPVHQWEAVLGSGAAVGRELSGTNE